MSAESTGLALDCEAAADVIVRALRREVERVGFSKVTLGLSGGLDSAVVAFLAARSFGAENVFPICMPYSGSNPESLAHGKLAAKALGIEAIVEDITPQIDSYYATHPRADRARRGNKMARERMTILYDYSMAESALVLGTSNKTELLLGYSTIFGDSAAALMPIGDLYKTQVFALAEYLGVPQEIIDKPPSADLWEGQSDEEELGFRYADVDALLVELIDRRQRPLALHAMGFDPEFVEQIQTRVRGQQYKRKMPVVIKLSSRTVDKDFLYPRDWSG